MACAQARARALARDAGLDVRAQWAAAIIASELSTNVLKFGPPGTLTLRRSSGPPPFLEIEAADRGPGLRDVDDALRDGVSEGVDYARLDVSLAGRRGLGLGLGAVHRLAAQLTIRARPGGGTIVLARVVAAEPSR